MRTRYVSIQTMTLCFALLANVAACGNSQQYLFGGPSGDAVQCTPCSNVCCADVSDCCPGTTCSEDPRCNPDPPDPCGDCTGQCCSDLDSPDACCSDLPCAADDAPECQNDAPCNECAGQCCDSVSNCCDDSPCDDSSDNCTGCNQCSGFCCSTVGNCCDDSPCTGC